MPASPQMQFHHSPTWPTGEPRVIMTPNRVWGPLVIGILPLLIFFI